MPFPYMPFPLLCTSNTELQGFSGNMSNMAFCMFLPFHDLPDFFCGRFSPVATQQQLPSLLPRLPAVDRLESLGVIMINERITGWREGMLFKDFFNIKEWRVDKEWKPQGITRYDSVWHVSLQSWLEQRLLDENWLEEERSRNSQFVVWISSKRLS